MSFAPAPILFVGAPRSGTTACFEHFSSHPDLAWIMNYARVFPRLPAINLMRRALDNRYLSLLGKKNQFDDVPWFNRALPRPDEAYRFWNQHGCDGFDRKFLLGQEATAIEKSNLRAALSKTRRYQGRTEITAKLTGPGRLHYLQSVWPELQVVHVIRDGAAVVRSLLNVDFWKQQGGYEHLWWQGGVSASEFKRWQNSGRDPGALAALQWRRIVETTREEGLALGQRYVELKYEDFLRDPEQEIMQIYQRFGLDTQQAELPAFAARNKIYSDGWSDGYRRDLVAWMSPLYEELGYRVPED